MESWEIERMKKEIREVGPGRIGRCFLGKAWGGFADCLKDEDFESLKKTWEDDMESVVVQAVMRAEEARSQSTSYKKQDDNPYLTPTSPSERVIRPLPSASSLSLTRGWVKSQLKRDSGLARKMKDVLKKEVAKTVEEMLQSANNQQDGQSSLTTKSFPCRPALLTPVTPSVQIPSPPASPPPFDDEHGSPSKTEVALSSSGSGLEPLSYEITYLAARLAKMIGMHENIYGPLYNEEVFN